MGSPMCSQLNCLPDRVRSRVRHLHRLQRCRRTFLTAHTQTRAGTHSIPFTVTTHQKVSKKMCRNINNSVITVCKWYEITSVVFLGGLFKKTNKLVIQRGNKCEKCFRREKMFALLLFHHAHSDSLITDLCEALSQPVHTGTAGGQGGMWPNMLPEVSVHVKHRCHFRQWLKRLTSPFTASPRCKTSSPLPTATTYLNYKLKKKYKNKVIMTIRGATAFFHTPKFLQVTIKWCHTCCFSLSPNKLQKDSF